MNGIFSETGELKKKGREREVLKMRLAARGWVCSIHVGPMLGGGIEKRVRQKGNLRVETILKRRDTRPLLRPYQEQDGRKGDSLPRATTRYTERKKGEKGLRQPQKVLKPDLGRCKRAKGREPEEFPIGDHVEGQQVFS